MAPSFDWLMLSLFARRAILAATEAALDGEEAAAEKASSTEAAQEEEGQRGRRLKVLLLLHGTATQILASLLPSSSSGSSASGEGAQLVEAASASISWLLGHPGSFWAAKAAGAMLSALRAQLMAGMLVGTASMEVAEKLLSVAALKATLPALLPLLSSRSQAVRDLMATGCSRYLIGMS